MGPWRGAPRARGFAVTVMGTAEIDEWLARARAGEEVGFLGLWRELQPRLLRFLRVLNCADPEDVAGETWLQVVRDLDRFHGDSDDFRRWLLTVARHRAIDAARARQRRPAMPLPDDFDALADGQAVEDRVIEALSADEAVRLLSAMTPDQARAVALRVIAGLDTTATASVLGRPRAAIRLALHRGLRALAKDPAILALAEDNTIRALFRPAEAVGGGAPPTERLTPTSPADTPPADMTR
jgi:RNA polymerase sigma-70 factor (ECF subfamily)